MLSAWTLLTIESNAGKHVRKLCQRVKLMTGVCLRRLELFACFSRLS